MSKPFSYAPPRTVSDKEQCYFYHRMAIPGVGEVGTEWDLRKSIDAYLGKLSYRNRRVLDVGTASGYLTFELESRGADVVSYDMDDGYNWDFVPHVSIQDRLDVIRREYREAHLRLQNAYWFAHERLRSRSRAFYGNLYDLPTDLGAFDVAVFGMILSHLRDPFQALYSVSRLVKGTIVITNPMMGGNQPIGLLIPSRDNNERYAWWAFSEKVLTQMLRVLGFEVQQRLTSLPRCLVPGRTGPEECVTLVAQRVEGRMACAA